MTWQATGVEEHNEQYAVPVSKLIESTYNDDKKIGFYIDLTVTKYLWEWDNGQFNDYNHANEITSLTHLPKLIVVDIPLDDIDGIDGETNLAVYRYHEGIEGISEKIPQYADQANEFGEYFKLNDNKITLHVRRFSVYAIAYEDQSQGGATITINKDGSLWTDVTIELKKDPGTPVLVNSGVTLDTLDAGTYNIYVNVNGVSENTGRTVTVRPSKIGAEATSATIDYYTLTLTPGTGIVSGSIIGEGVYLEGKTVSIDADLISNYSFSKWTAEPEGAYGDLNRQSTTITMPNHELKLTATAIRFGNGGGNSGGGSIGGGNSGSDIVSNVIIIPSAYGSVATSLPYPYFGNQVAVIVKPDAGYELDKLVITDENGKDIAFVDNGDGTYTYTQPLGIVTVTTTFKAITEDVDPGNTDKNKESISKPGVEPDDITTDVGGPDDFEPEADEPDVNDSHRNNADNGTASNIVKDKEPKTGDNSFSLTMAAILGALACLIRMLMDKKIRYKFVKIRVK